jgi:hypothetical protein
MIPRTTSFAPRRFRKITIRWPHPLGFSPSPQLSLHWRRRRLSLRPAPQGGRGALRALHISQSASWTDSSRGELWLTRCFNSQCDSILPALLRAKFIARRFFLPANHGN